MKPLQLIFLCLIMMLISPDKIVAQKHDVLHLRCSTAGQLPEENGHENLGVAGAFAGVHNKAMLVAGGANFPDKMPWLGGKKAYHSTIYAFRKNRDGKITFQPKQFSLPFPVAYGASVSTSQGIFCAGGETENGLSKRAFLLRWQDEKTTTIDLPDLPVAVANAMATQHDDVVYLCGGEAASGVSNRFFSLDFKAPSPNWKEEMPLPKPVSHAVFVAQKNSSGTALYLIGGRKKNSSAVSELYNSVYAFDLKQKKWTVKKALPYVLSAGTGTATSDHSILLFGGDKGETFHKTEELIARIDKEKDPVKKASLIQQKTEMQQAHPGFSRDVLMYDTMSNSWTKIATLPFAAQVTTVAFGWDDAVIIPSGEVKAGVRTPDINLVKIK